MVKFGFSTRKKNPISKFIRWVTGSKASHAWLLIENSFLGEHVVMEATEGGFRLYAYSNFERDNDVVAVIAPRAPLDEGVRAAVKWVGKSHYDYTGLFGAAFVQLGKWLKMKWRNPLNVTSAMFCSEAVVYVMKVAKYPGAEALNPSATSPQDLLDFLSRG